MQVLPKQASLSNSLSVLCSPVWISRFRAQDAWECGNRG